LRFRRIVRLLLLQLLLLLLREVMSDNATDRCAGHRVMAGNVSRNRAYRGTLDATLRRGSLRTQEEGESEQRHGNGQPFHVYFPQHASVPFEHFAWVKSGVHVATLEILLPWFRPSKPCVRPSAADTGRSVENCTEAARCGSIGVATRAPLEMLW
jgi:hypothetical protein